jgi:uncharacterized protein
MALQPDTPANPYPQPDPEAASVSEPVFTDGGVRVDNEWPWWTAPAALVGGLLLAGLGALAVDIPAALLGVSITSSHTPGGIELADTVVQDVGFVAAAVIFAHVGGRAVRAWQFGLRPPRLPWRRVALVIVGLLVAFIVFTAIWEAIINVESKEKLLEQLGANEGTGLLLLSAALTCVMAPICEELLFRGFIFQSLRSWRGTWPAAIITGLIFGGVHAGSAPAVDLVPLAGLGFGLCLLYRYTDSLYPCIAAHSLNNSLAFGALEHWRWWQIVVLMACALAVIALLALGLRRAGVITAPPADLAVAPTEVATSVAAA